MTLIALVVPAPRPVAPHHAVMPSVSDYNLLLSTVATLSGAVAAIIGGFVLAALLSLSSDRNSLVELLADRRRAKTSIQRALELKKSESEAEFRRLIFEWLRMTYRRQDAPPVAAELAARIVALNLATPICDADELAEIYLQERQRADLIVAATVPRLAESSDLGSFASWLGLNTPSDANIEYLNDAFDRAMASIARQGALSGNETRPDTSRGSTPAETDARALAQTELVLRNWSATALDADIRRLQDDLARATDATADVEQRLRTRRLPSHLGLGIVVLAINVSIGVFYPLSMMPAVTVNASALRSVKIGAIVQVCAIIAYIVLLAAQIRWPKRKSAAELGG